eukprot:252899-Pleurochrysis_carterae.AAC.1
MGMRVALRGVWGVRSGGVQKEKQQEGDCLRGARGDQHDEKGWHSDKDGEGSKRFQPFSSASGAWAKKASAQKTRASRAAVDKQAAG